MRVRRQKRRIVTDLRRTLQALQIAALRAKPKLPHTKPIQNPHSRRPTEEESPISSQPVEETQPEPEFEISYWITFAKDYAKSLGLNLDAAAVDCWDNPITAGSHCIYLERDIKNRLNRYSKDEDITDVWIWAVDLGNGSYDLYIGYA